MGEIRQVNAMFPCSILRLSSVSEQNKMYVIRSKYKVRELKKHTCSWVRKDFLRGDLLPLLTWRVLKVSDSQKHTTQNNVYLISWLLSNIVFKPDFKFLLKS